MLTLLRRLTPTEETRLVELLDHFHNLFDYRGLIYLPPRVPVLIVIIDGVLQSLLIRFRTRHIYRFASSIVEDNIISLFTAREVRSRDTMQIHAFLTTI